MSENVQDLLRTIENGTREDIWEAAKQLESFTLGVVSALLRLLKNGQSADARAAAAYVLGFCRYSSARIDLEQILDDTSEEAFVRGHAAEALAYLGSRESVEMLLKHSEDRNPGVRYWCVFALGEIGDPKSLPVLRHLLDKTGDELFEGHSLRGEILDAIAEIGEQRGENAS
jgi:HEAT repeat protein